jgi:hypothetical protein
MLEFTLQRVFSLLKAMVNHPNKLKLELQLNFSNQTPFSSARKDNRRTKSGGMKSSSPGSNSLWPGL